jgi:hypothetical protein
MTQEQRLLWVRMMTWRLLRNKLMREKISECLEIPLQSLSGKLSRQVLDEFVQRDDVTKTGLEFTDNLLKLCQNILFPESAPFSEITADSASIVFPVAQTPVTPLSPETVHLVPCSSTSTPESENSITAMAENPPPLPESIDLPLLAPGAIPSGYSPTVPPLAKVFFTLNKNAKVGEAFQADIQTLNGKEVDIVDVIVPENLGLAYDAEQRRVHGTPTTDGEHALSVRYRFSDGPELERPTLEGRCTLIVNPDPRSLWKNLPSNRDDPDWKPDTDQQNLPGEHGMKLVAASKRGRSHAHVGGFRDDDFFLDTAVGWNILAVADGAGSARLSRLGSKIATSRAGQFIKAKLNGEEGRQFEEAAAQSAASGAAKTALYSILGGAAFDAAKAIEEEAASRGNTAKDYATTLILAIHRKTSFGHLIAAYWVGDGAVAVYRQGAAVELLGEADSGEFAGQTRFLDHATVASGEEIMKRLRITIVPDFTALILMTDGISDPKFETDRNLADLGYWDALWQELAPTLNRECPDGGLLDWLDFWSPGNHDDRTIAMLAG